MNLRWRRVLVVALLGIALSAGAIGIVFWWVIEPTPPISVAGAAPGVSAFFQDVTATSGVQFSHRNGEQADLCTILESLGGGVALFDFDGDGLLDVFLTGGGYFTGYDFKTIAGNPCKLYKNLGNWQFQDVTEQSGLDIDWFYNQGCAVADYDRDGWPDLLVTGYGQLALFHNESDGRGGRRFVEVTKKAGLGGRFWATGAAWADLDGDGYPDLYLCQYVNWNWQTHVRCRREKERVHHDICEPARFTGLPHRLFRNNRNGTFTDVSKEAGLDPRCTTGLGVVVVDVDDDRRPDIYAVNDGERNYFYVNRSRPGKLRFSEAAFPAGVAMGDSARADGSMGVDAADYDGCGRPSLLVATFEKQLTALYHNDSTWDKILFHYASRPAGFASQDPGYVGFGAAFVDVDLDGWEDVVLSNGHAYRFPTTSGVKQKASLLRNLGDGVFSNVSFQGGTYFQAPHRGRGLAVGDLDNDGRPDLVLSHLNEPVVLLRNAPVGDGISTPHWLGLELVGRKYRDTAGAKVVVELKDRRLTRFAKGGAGYLSSSDRRLLFGLGDADKIEGVTVFWPWGQSQHWKQLTSDRYWELREGEPAAQSPRGSSNNRLTPNK